MTNPLTQTADVIFEIPMSAYAEYIASHYMTDDQREALKGITTEQVTAAEEFVLQNFYKDEISRMLGEVMQETVGVLLYGLPSEDGKVHDE